MKTLDTCRRWGGVPPRWINEHSKGIVFVLTCLFFPVAIAQSTNKLLWFDELITMHIARLGTPARVWEALARGADPNPPLSHLLAMWSIQLFGESATALRLPSIVAGWVAAMCVFVFLRRRVPPLFAAAGALVLMGTMAFDYSYEARSYALITAFAPLALVCWQSIVLGRHRLVMVAGLALALAAGVSTNYYAVLAFVPIAGGELVRSIERRRIDWVVWVALVIGAVPLLFYRKLIAVGMAKFLPFAWNKPELSQIWTSYTRQVPNLGWVTLALAVAAGWMIRQQRRSESGTPVLSRAEVAAVWLLAAYPVIGFVLAVARAGMFSPRFVLPMCAGVAIAFGLLLYKVLRDQHWAVALLALALLVAWFGSREQKIYVRYERQRAHFHSVLEHVPASGKIATPDPLLVLTMHYYAPPDVASRIVYPINLEAVRHYRGDDSGEQNLWAGRDFVFPVPLPRLEDFERENPSYSIVGTRDNWLVQFLYDRNDVPSRLAIETHNRAVWAQTPISFGELYFFERTARSPAPKSMVRAMR